MTPPSDLAGYWQAGAPSEVAIPRAGVIAPTKISQLLAVLALVMLAVQPACVPLPVVTAPSVLPVLAQNDTLPAGVGLAQLVAVWYLIESAKYASSAVTRLRRSDFIAAMCAFSFVLANLGIAMAAKMPMITTTISSSISVKPMRFMLIPVSEPSPRAANATGPVPMHASGMPRAVSTMVTILGAATCDVPSRARDGWRRRLRRGVLQAFGDSQGSAGPGEAAGIMLGRR